MRLRNKEQKTKGVGNIVNKFPSARDLGFQMSLEGLQRILCDYMIGGLQKFLEVTILMGTNNVSRGAAGWLSTLSI